MGHLVQPRRNNLLGCSETPDWCSRSLSRRATSIRSHPTWVPMAPEPKASPCCPLRAASLSPDPALAARSGGCRVPRPGWHVPLMISAAPIYFRDNRGHQRPSLRPGSALPGSPGHAGMLRGLPASRAAPGWSPGCGGLGARHVVCWCRAASRLSPGATVRTPPLKARAKGVRGTRTAGSREGSRPGCDL